jgi:hypothetical protein
MVGWSPRDHAAITAVALLLTAWSQPLLAALTNTL